MSNLSPRDRRDTSILRKKGGVNRERALFNAIHKKGAAVASAATISLKDPSCNVTGTTTITAIASAPRGEIHLVRFTGILTLTYNATSLILPGLANITTAANDTAEFYSDGDGNWICIKYVPADGSTPGILPIPKGGTGQSTAVAAKDALTVVATPIASATTTDIGAATGEHVLITGTTTITGFGTKTAGAVRNLQFEGALTLTYHATQLVLPTEANITTAAGDKATMVSAGSGNWVCILYTRANGDVLKKVPITLGGTNATTAYDAACNILEEATVDANTSTTAGSANASLVHIANNAGTNILAFDTGVAGALKWIDFTQNYTLTPTTLGDTFFALGKGPAALNSMQVMSGDQILFFCSNGTVPTWSAFSIHRSSGEPVIESCVYSSLSSASTTNIDTTYSRYITIDGTTTINAFGTAGVFPGSWRILRFLAALQITHGASLILPNATNITTVANDEACFLYDGSVWRLHWYKRAASGLMGPGVVSMTATDVDVADLVPIHDSSATADKSVTVSRLLGYASVSLCEGRLSLDSTNPVTTTDQTAKTGIYLVPHTGDRITVFDGTRLRLYSFSSFGLLIGTVTASLPYDIFVYDNAGTLELEQLAWTNGTTRATALVRQNGAWYKTGALTRRYLGTYYSTSTTTMEDSLLKRNVFNAHNRLPRSLVVQDATNTWNYSTAAWRQANASSANQVEFVLGLSEEPVEALAFGAAATSAATNRLIRTGIGLNATTANSANIFDELHCSSTMRVGVKAFYKGFPAVGYNYLAWLEYGAGADTQTWVGDNAGACQTGLTGTVWG